MARRPRKPVQTSADVARVRFLRAYTYTPSLERRVSTKFPAGHEGLVKGECARTAIALGAAEIIETPES